MRSTPLLLLHGFLGCKDDWHEVATALRPGRRIAVFDLPGHGAHDEIDPLEDCSIEAACERIDAVLDALQAPSADIVGYSMGGRIALAYAASRPSKVASLVLESASPGIESEEQRAARRLEDEGRAQDLEARGIEAFVLDWEALPLFDSQRALTAQRRAGQRTRRMRSHPQAIARSLRQAGSGSQAWLGDALAGFDFPVLLVAGSLDTKFTAIARAMHERLTRAELAIVGGAGHNVHLEQPDAFVALLRDFLDGPAAAGAGAGERP